MRITALEALSLGKKSNSLQLPIGVYNLLSKKHIDEVLVCFPCLEKKIHSCTLLNDNSLRITYSLEGLLITKKELEQRGLTAKDAKDYFRNYFEIYCIIPHDYCFVGCQVFDLNNYINWKMIPDEHRHLNGKSAIYGNLLCTHLFVEARDMNNPILENLKTAHDLFKAYNYYIKTHIWTLDEYKHGKEGEKQYYEKRRLQNCFR